MNRSDIFERYAKIAQEDDEKDLPEHTEQDFHETNPRMDSLSIEQIGKLYNNKPDSPKEMAYKKNIMEVAHPEPMVISPSYDKLNGLVENENEGQNIRINILMQTPTGQLLNRKYAEQELIMSLVRVANDLDHHNQDNLRALADVCLTQATGKKLKKVAFIPVAIGLVAAVGALYAKQHLRMHSDGFERDYQKTMEEINDLLNSSTNMGIVGYTYNPQFLKIVNKLQSYLTTLHNSVEKVMPIIMKMDTPKDREELLQIAQQPATKEATEAITQLETVVEQVYPYINGVITNFSNPGFKQRAIAEKGVLSNIVDSAEILHGGNALIADDFDDVAHALQTLKFDIDNIVKTLQGAKDEQADAQQKLEASQAETNQVFHSKPAEQETPSEEPNEMENFTSSIGKEFTTSSDGVGAFDNLSDWAHKNYDKNYQ